MTDRDRQLRILIVGGVAGFTSSFLVRDAAARGHAVTALTRGVRTSRGSAPVPDGVEVLVGDRASDLGALRGREFDAVVDFGAYDPDAVTQIASAIESPETLYVLISTIMTYDFDDGPLDEDSAVLQAPERLDQIPPDQGWIRYGRGKVLAEERARALGRPVLVVRPGVIAGPGDRAAHLEYWYDRWNRPGAIVVPGDPGDPVQFVDSRDLAAWLLLMIEKGGTGTYNAVGPTEPATMADLLTTISEEIGDPRPIEFIPTEWLTERGVFSSGDPFFWVKPHDRRLPEEFWINYRISDARARVEGLVSRPLRETVRDTIAAFRANPPDTDGGPYGGGRWASDHDDLALLAEWRRHPRPIEIDNRSQ